MFESITTAQTKNDHTPKAATPKATYQKPAAHPGQADQIRSRGTINKQLFSEFHKAPMLQWLSPAHPIIRNQNKKQPISA